MSVRSIIVSQFEAVAGQQRCRLAPLADDLQLQQSGLDSLSFAIIVARLEDEFGFDPFNAADSRAPGNRAGGHRQFPRTFGDFVRLYESSPSPR